MPAILITDSLLRKSLSLTRSLGKQGLDIDTADRTRCTPSAFSKHCTRALKSPDPITQRAAYAEWLLRTLAEEKYELLIPSDDIAIETVLKHRTRVEALTTVLLPPVASYQMAADKRLTMEVAKKAQVPHPNTLWPQAQTAEELEQLAAALVYPVVIKPRQSSGSRGIRIVTSQAELCTVYWEVDKEFPKPLLQEYIPAGERFDVALLFDRSGELKASFVQREVRHFPVAIGPSTVQESVWMPELVEQAMRLMQQLPWQGVVEVEFMRDPRDGRHKLMELNPRWWNSLEMAVQAGVDFPYLYYQAAKGHHFEAVHTYQIGLFCRNLLPGDLLHFFANPKRKSMNPPLISWRNNKLRDDILSQEDPLATVGFLAGVARLLFDRNVWRMMFRR